MEKEFRMYGLVNYQLTGIQGGIQFGHAVVEYGLEYFDTDEYQQWARYNKTFIILNGGTSSEDKQVKQGYDTFTYTGTMQEHLKET